MNNLTEMLSDPHHRCDTAIIMVTTAISTVLLQINFVPRVHACEILFALKIISHNSMQMCIKNSYV